MARLQDHFLTPAERLALQVLLRERKAAGLRIRRANALLLLDDGFAPLDVARVLYLDEETIRSWKRGFESDGLSSLDLNVYSKRDGHLTADQETELTTLFREKPPKTVGEVRAVIEKLFDVTYSTSGAIRLMGRLGFCYKKPKALPMGADEAAQIAPIKAYETLLNGLESDESVVFADAVHPEYQSRPAHGWFPKDEKVAIKATSGRKRLNIHGAFDLETSRLTWLEGERISAQTTLSLFKKLETAYPDKRLIHVFLDNARYHHAKMLRPWLERKDCRIKLHFLPSYAPNLNPIERLWGIMHQHITHNQYYSTFNEFVDAVIGFLRNTVSKKTREWRDTITDNFRVISQKNYRLIG